MYRVRALLIVIALAAAACSSVSEAAEVEAPTTTQEASAPTQGAASPTSMEAPSAPTLDVTSPTSPTSMEAPSAPTLDAEPASETTQAAEASEDADSAIVIQTEIDWATEVGTFDVDQGAELLGCSSGSVVQAQGVPSLTNVFTCEDGDREGTFTVVWTIDPESEGPGQANGPWSVLDATGDFAGLTGDGLGSGDGNSTTGFGSFPGMVEFGPIGPASTGADSALVAEVAAYTAAFGTGDADLAWSMISPRCQGISDETEYREAVEYFAGELPGLTAMDVSAVVFGESAFVNYGTSEPGLVYVAQPWAFVDGSWHWDAC